MFGIGSAKRKIDKTSFIPVYYQLVKILEDEIHNGMMPGDVLPTEQEISTYFGISRMTVRRAIAELTRAGKVYAEKGRGTFVAKPKLDSLVFELGDYYKEMKQKGINPNSKLLEARIVRADDKIFQEVGIPVGVRCLYYRVVHMVGNEPLVYETKYIVYSKKKPLLEVELINSSLSSLLTNHVDPPVRSKRVLQVRMLSDDEVGILKVEPNTPAFHVEQILYDIENNPLAWGTSLYRGDRYKIVNHTGWFGRKSPKDGGFNDGE
ncbi:MAG TPA: GntR family transcriptional regulator [Clostridia bacterium]|nr:GntR family transcriptional regulator [Clostridia bacterium]